jgi:hypothetical protein
MSLLHILISMRVSKILWNFKIFSGFRDLISSPVEWLTSNIAILEMEQLSWEGKGY